MQYICTHSSSHHIQTQRQYFQKPANTAYSSRVRYPLLHSAPHDAKSKRKSHKSRNLCNRTKWRQESNPLHTRGVRRHCQLLSIACRCPRVQSWRQVVGRSQGRWERHSWNVFGGDLHLMVQMSTASVLWEVGEGGVRTGR